MPKAVCEVNMTLPLQEKSDTGLHCWYFANTLCIKDDLFELSDNHNS